MLARLTLAGLGASTLIAGCTGDFDAFSFDATAGGAGGDGATGNASSGGDGATGNASSGGGGNGTGGAGNASSGGGGTGTGGSGGAAVLVACGVQSCDVTSGAACCVDLDTEAATCEADGKCDGGEVEVECDGPEDCPGEECCADEKGGDYDHLRCRGNCGGGDETVCHVGDDSPCSGNDTCEVDIPGGYGICD